MGPEHWTAIIVAVVGPTIGGMFVWLQGLNRRTSDMKARIEKLERRERLSWIYIRSLIDSHYRHAPGVELPAPPEGWNED